MSPRTKLTLQTIPEDETMSPQQPDCLALLDVLQRDGIALHGQSTGWFTCRISLLQPCSLGAASYEHCCAADLGAVLPEHLHLLKPLLESLDRGQDLEEPSACSNRRGRSLLRCSVSLMPWHLQTCNEWHHVGELWSCMPIST